MVKANGEGKDEGERRAEEERKMKKAKDSQHVHTLGTSLEQDSCMYVSCIVQTCEHCLQCSHVPGKPKC